MVKLNIYCTTIQYYNVLDKLPSYIKPLGLGNFNYPENWLSEKVGQNISSLNKYYGDTTGTYWVWKNHLKNYSDDDWIGNCHYRKLWLNDLLEKKQKFSTNSLYSKLLKPDNKIFSECDSIQVQPIIFKNENLFSQFEKIHKKNILENCIEFLDIKNKRNFTDYLNKNKLSGLNMFITKAYNYNKYCENLFPWMEMCYNYCMKNNLCESYNTRLPAFLAERYTSYWFSQNTNVKYLSYARLGKFMLSNKVNKLINPTKIPFSFRMYPTIHDY